jgi:hypothetical protein
VSFAAITLCVVSQRVFIVAIVYLVTTQSGNFWIHPHTLEVVVIKEVACGECSVSEDCVLYE